MPPDKIVGGRGAKNTLFFGDNLEILRQHIKDESVDLVYLDPPFNSKADYNILFKTPDNVSSPSQITAFEDSWHWTSESELVYGQLLNAESRIASVIRGMREAIGENDMMAYLVMMAIRLIELHRVLKPTGSLYLHCDPTASHYLKIILDAVFGVNNFKNEIIWKRTSNRVSGKRFGRIHDTIMFYGKSEETKFQAVKIKRDQSYIDRFYRHKDAHGTYRISDLTGAGIRNGESGKPWRGIDPTKRGNHWRGRGTFPPHVTKSDGYEKMSVHKKLDELDELGLIHWPKKQDGMPGFKLYLDETDGMDMADIITDIQPLSHNSAEKMGYPTQKPITLLERIIKASSNEGDTILDPFCGCGTAVHASQKLNRNWIGIDITHLAIGLIEKRMRDAFGIKVNVRGTPSSFDSAKDLAKRNKFQFEAWAVTLIPNVLPNTKQVGDRGVDGRGYIQLGKDERGKRIDAQIIVSVKGGDNLTPSMVRDLVGTLRNEKAELGVFVCLKEPTRKMKEAAATAGMFETPFGEPYPKLQIYTISDYFNGVRPNLPSLADFIKAPRSEMEPKGTQTTL